MSVLVQDLKKEQYDRYADCVNYKGWIGEKMLVELQSESHLGVTVQKGNVSVIQKTFQADGLVQN